MPSLCPCRKLDDRTWPLEDLELVSLLFAVLEHTTNSKRMKAKFEPRAVLLRRLYGAHPPPPAPASSLTRQQTLVGTPRGEGNVFWVGVQGGSKGGAPAQAVRRTPPPAPASSLTRQQTQVEKALRKVCVCVGGGGRA